MSRLLFITQKVDKDDDVLGTYHRWLEELSKKLDRINVICLYKGRVELPSNVAVFSLGKERGSDRWVQMVLFYKYVWFLRKDYDAVFVHMNPIYIVLGGLFWKLTRKKLFLWYNHPLGNLTARIGIFFSNKVFCTSSYSFAARYKKTIIMPVGIDTTLFKPLPNVVKKHNRILFLGRVSPIKKIKLLIEAVKLLDARGIDFELLIVGSATSPKDKEYELKLKKLASDLISNSKVIFRSSVPNYKTPEIYNSSGIFVNLTPTGSFDKTTLEAMSCGTLVLVSNNVFKRFFSLEAQKICMFNEDSVEDLLSKIEPILLLPDEKKQELSNYLQNVVVKNHSLDGLIRRLYEKLAGNLL